MNLSACLNEKLIRQAVPDVKDISFHYPKFRNIIARNNSNISKEKIDKIFARMTESALRAKNPFAVTVRTLLSYLGTEEEEDILDEIEIHTRSYEYLEYRDNKHQ